mmetsp:Transcript_33853/g.86008  ORF Transcript_33853/g.86008 Transcript_33853/m.86008 type:complete len:204 (+) Transcript_33853:58-669(+)
MAAEATKARVVRLLEAVAAEAIERAVAMARQLVEATRARARARVVATAATTMARAEAVARLLDRRRQSTVTAGAVTPQAKGRVTGASLGKRCRKGRWSRLLRRACRTNLHDAPRCTQGSHERCASRASLSFPRSPRIRGRSCLRSRPPRRPSCAWRPPCLPRSATETSSGRRRSGWCSRPSMLSAGSAARSSFARSSAARGPS